ncbi:50S ribosomal protein L31, partial [Candidatus Gottesmanbacteria bacterium RBG_13_37_7]
PKYYDHAQVVCACGNIFTIGATKEKISVEVCYKCHPFFTGEMKFVDTLGRVERFQKKQEIGKKSEAKLIEKKRKKAGLQTEERQPRTLREMLMGTS